MGTRFYKRNEMIQMLNYDMDLKLQNDYRDRKKKKRENTKHYKRQRKRKTQLKL